MGQTAENVKQRRFAAARRADNGNEFALFDLQRYAAQSLHVHFADAVGLANVLSFNHPCHANLRYYTKWEGRRRRWA